MSASYRILIAEDDEALGPLLVELLLAEGYEVDLAKDGQEALAYLKSQSYQMLISDIQMPRLDGFGLLEEISTLYPGMQRILMTAFNADEYMDLISRQGVGSVLIKSVPFDDVELRLAVKQLATGQIFGLENHMQSNAELTSLIVREPSQIEEISTLLATKYGDDIGVSRIRTVLVELLTNAIFYGARQEAGEDKSKWNTQFVLPENEAITISYGSDSEKVGFSVVDQGGRLTKDTILYWLNRQITPGINGLPDGLFDSHGRGIFIVRKYMDQLLIHVDPGKRCECITLNWKNGVKKNAYKPIRIIEMPST